MKAELKIIFNDGTNKMVTAVFADFVAFERTWNRSVTNLEAELRLTDLAWLCWHSEKRRMMTTHGFDPEWIGTVDNITLGDNGSDGEIPLPSPQQQE